MFFCDYQGQVEHKPRERLSPCVEAPVNTGLPSRDEPFRLCFEVLVEVLETPKTWFLPQLAASHCSPRFLTPS